MKIRRVVTGHDANGKAVILKDGDMTNVKTMASGHSGCLMWVTDEALASVDGEEDPSVRDLGIAPPKQGTVLRILELVPGKAFMHRTDTIDYCLVLEGECVMKLDDEAEVSLKAGDVLVQRGTWHGWENRGTARCRLAFVLMASKPPSKTLHEAH